AARLEKNVIFPGRGRGKVRRPAHRLLRLRKYVRDCELLIGVVAERDGVYSGGPKRTVIPRVQAGSVGSVLSVGDDERETLSSPELRHQGLHGRQARRADHVAEEEETHVASVLTALRTERATTSLRPPHATPEQRSL